MVVSWIRAQLAIQSLPVPPASHLTILPSEHTRFSEHILLSLR